MLKQQTYYSISGRKVQGSVGFWPGIKAAFPFIDKNANIRNTQILAKAIDKADPYDADIITVSLGIQKNHRQIRQAVEYAGSKGVLAISTMVNNGADT